MPRKPIAQLSFTQIYPLLVQKAERKGRTREDVDTVTCWLTGYSRDDLERQLARDVTYETFFAEAPCLNPNRTLITGKICGIDVATIENPVEQNARYLDKLVDELARGRAIETILRQPRSRDIVKTACRSSCRNEHGFGPTCRKEKVKMSDAPIRIKRELEAIADPAYRSFQAKLVPTVDAARILGVRTPALRAYAKRLVRERADEAYAFLNALPHATYDENNLHGELIGRVAQTPEEAFTLLDAFLPFVDNWATCDLIRVPAFKHDLPAVLGKIRLWIAAEHEYTVRFGVVQFMTLFLDDAFDPGQLDLIAAIDRPEYYINMARAWYFSFALIKQPCATLPLFEQRPIALDAWTHNKALQKARESRRISTEQKAYLQSLKV